MSGQLARAKLTMWGCKRPSDRNPVHRRTVGHHLGPVSFSGVMEAYGVTPEASIDSWRRSFFGTGRAAIRPRIAGAAGGDALVEPGGGLAGDARADELRCRRPLTHAETVLRATAAGGDALGVAVLGATEDVGAGLGVRAGGRRRGAA